MGQLTLARVRRTTASGRHADDGTLYLYIAPGGSQSRVQRITVRARRRGTHDGLATLRPPAPSMLNPRQLA